ncbi:MAG TPA: AAA family ATPase [Pirellulales bacterium]|nr:AAA family ATPase [Pirellulales bacterium]
MRIDQLHIKNFKKFSDQALDLHPQFTLLVGENGSGKTTILDALAVALGVWLLDVPDSDVKNSQRPIYTSEIRLEPIKEGDRTLFREAPAGVTVSAHGEIAEGEPISWTREIPRGAQKVSNVGAKQARKVIASLYDRSERQEGVILPVVSYYGAGRSWLPHHERKKAPARANAPARRWAAFYDCLNERIRLADLNEWFKGEAIAAVNLGGRFRPGFEVVRQAVMRCIPGADSMWYDGDRSQIVLSINGQAQPFGNLSAGQRMMLALVADIAIKAVTQNNGLVPSDSNFATRDGPPPVLARTTGVVLIDELDVHLHPRWQRRVATDLKTTFPNLQFVCTSHSPQIIGEVEPDEIRLLDEPNVGLHPAQSFGLDSNAVLEEIQGADSQDIQIRALIDAVEQALDIADLPTARQRLLELRERVHGPTPDTTRLEATINNLEALADAAD